VKLSGISSPDCGLVLDLFSGEGGAGTGYAKAGYEVIGIDNDPVALYRYPGESYCLDWHDGLEKFADQAALIHASPPCQRYSVLTPADARGNHPDLVSEVRRALQETRKPYLIENVPGAPLVRPVALCGCMFDLTVEHHGKMFALYRKRLFEAGGWRLPGLRCGTHDLPFIPVCHDDTRAFRELNPGVKLTGDVKREVMGCPWMSDEGVTEAIPPAFTSYIGRRFRQSDNGRTA
jgi:DNA (cytosine-5)-methyltransferase 1